MKRLFSGTLCAAVLWTLGGAVWAGEPKDDAYGGSKNGEHKQPNQAMRDAWLKMAAPGTFHAHLKPLVGTWKTVSKWWMAPQADPTVSEGTSKKSLILGGRYVRETYESSAMGMPFQGMGIIGYDNTKRKYTSLWLDTMSTSMMMDLGTCDASGKVFTFHGVYDDPSTKQKKKIRTVLTIVNNDRHVLEMYEGDPSGKERKTLEVTYTRR